MNKKHKRIIESLGNHIEEPLPNPHRGVSIISPKQYDCPQKGHIISSDDGDHYRVLDCNKMCARLINLTTGEKILVSGAKIILATDNRGPHWHLQRTRNRGIVLHDKPNTIYRSLSNSLVLSGEKAKQLKILVDDAGHKIAAKIYKTYVSDEDMSNAPQFLMDLDDLISKYRGGKPLDSEEGDNEKDDEEENEDEFSGVEESNVQETNLSIGEALKSKLRV